MKPGGGVKKRLPTVADGKVSLVRVDMAEPKLKTGFNSCRCIGENRLNISRLEEGREWRELPACRWESTCGGLWSTPNILNWKIWFLQFEHHPRISKKMELNTEFVHVISRRKHTMAGVANVNSAETLACGTKSCAATVTACILNHKTENKVLVHVCGGIPTN